MPLEQAIQSLLLTWWQFKAFKEQSFYSEFLRIEEMLSALFQYFKIEYPKNPITRAVISYLEVKLKSKKEQLIQYWGIDLINGFEKQSTTFTSNHLAHILDVVDHDKTDKALTTALVTSIQEGLSEPNTMKGMSQVKSELLEKIKIFSQQVITSSNEPLTKIFNDMVDHKKSLLEKQAEIISLFRKINVAATNEIQLDTLEASIRDSTTDSLFPSLTEAAIALDGATPTDLSEILFRKIKANLQPSDQMLMEKNEHTIAGIQQSLLDLIDSHRKVLTAKSKTQKNIQLLFSADNQALIKRRMEKIGEKNRSRESFANYIARKSPDTTPTIQIEDTHAKLDWVLKNQKRHFTVLEQLANKGTKEIDRLITQQMLEQGKSPEQIERKKQTTHDRLALSANWKVEDIEVGQASLKRHDPESHEVTDQFDIIRQIDSTATEIKVIQGCDSDKTISILAESIIAICHANQDGRVFIEKYEHRPKDAILLFQALELAKRSIEEKFESEASFELSVTFSQETSEAIKAYSEENGYELTNIGLSEDMFEKPDRPSLF